MSAGLPPVEAFLRHFHDDAPGGSPRAFAPIAVHDDQGRHWPSSYHALLQVEHAAARPAVPLPQGPRLDLGCGDGHLLQLLSAQGAGPLLGVDLSHGELQAARHRLGPDTARLMQARAQALPLATGSLATVTSHMALMLMRPPEAVLAELARVLRSGGLLLAVLPRAAPPGDAVPPLHQAWLDALRPEPRDTRWAGVQFPGHPWCDAAALKALMSADFHDLQLSPLQARQPVTPMQALAWFDSSYDPALLTAEARARVGRRFIERAQALASAPAPATSLGVADAADAAAAGSSAAGLTLSWAMWRLQARRR